MWTIWLQSTTNVTVYIGISRHSNHAPASKQVMQKPEKHDQRTWFRCNKRVLQYSNWWTIYILLDVVALDGVPKRYSLFISKYPLFQVAHMKFAAGTWVCTESAQQPAKSFKQKTYTKDDWILTWYANISTMIIHNCDVYYIQWYKTSSNLNIKNLLKKIEKKKKLQHHSFLTLMLTPYSCRCYSSSSKSSRKSVKFSESTTASSKDMDSFFLGFS